MDTSVGLLVATERVFSAVFAFVAFLCPVSRAARSDESDDDYWTDEYGGFYALSVGLLVATCPEESGIQTQTETWFLCPVSRAARSDWWFGLVERLRW